MEKKKIISYQFNQAKGFIINNFPQLITLVFLLQLLIAIRDFPYINIIDNYYIYVFMLVFFLAWVFFYKYFTSKRMLVMAIVFLALAYPTVVLHMTQVSELLGFVSYILLVMAILQKIVTEKKLLRKVQDEHE
jgi:hypothetical protein